MCNIKSLLRLLTLLMAGVSLQSNAAVTVYCCDANAEAQFIQDLAALQSVTVDFTGESFEGDAWTSSRNTTVFSVTNQNLTWGASSTGVAGIQTSMGGGDVHEGEYLMFAVDDTSTHLTPDKITLTANGITLYGVGGWFRSSNGAKLALTTNGDVVDFTGAQATVFDWKFLGFIDDGGFSTLLVETADEVGNEVKTFFSDDFTIAAEAGAFPGQDLQFSSANYSANENAGSVAVTVSRSGGTTGALSIDYATTTDGTATAGQDFTAVSGTLDFADGETSKQITINILDDAVFEGDETVGLLLTGTDVGVLNNATLTIVENDARPAGSVEFSGSSYRVNEDAGTLSVTIQRSGGSEGSGTIDYAISDGTATGGSDYNATSGTLTFIDGQVSGTFDITITDDTLQEGTESIVLNLSNPVSVMLGDRDIAEVSIIDNEASPAMGSIQFSGSTYSVAENGSEIALPVVRISGSMGAVSVVCTTSDSSATAGNDYTATQNTVSFANGEVIQNCRIPIVDDSSYENDETLLVTLSSPTNGAVLGTTSSTTVTIEDNDPVPAAGSLQFDQTSYQLTESGSTASITVSRSGGSSGSVNVDYATVDGTATAGSDYTSASGTINFAAGVTSVSFQVALLDDAIYEGDETVSLVLSNPTGGAVTGSADTAQLTILDNESAPATGALVFTASEYFADELDGSITVSVERQGGSTGAAQVNYITSDGTAIAGADYAVASGTLAFADGEVSQSFEIFINDDAFFEGTENLSLQLSDPFGVTLGDPASSVITIADDDDPPAAGALDFSTNSYSVDETGTSITVTVTRSGGTSGAISVDYATLDDSATASSDYVFATGTVNFANGESGSKTFEVTIVDDSLLEQDERIRLVLANVQGGAVLGALSESFITISDDEAQSASAILGFSAGSLSANETAGSVNITITRSVTVSGEISVDLSASSSDAVAGTDYNVTTGTVRFANGETEKTITVEILDNTVTDGNRTITFALANAIGTAVIDSNSGTLTLTIIDDESDSGGGGGGGGGSMGSFLMLLMLCAIFYLRLQGFRVCTACSGRNK
ncbi:MAG: Calx-beta domain-containing protein [Candidatus Thiodiazotropha endolucinida]